MNFNPALVKTRIQRFDAEFPSIANREYWLSTYLQLREGGDNHSDAVETIRGEMLMDRMKGPKTK